MVKVSSTKPVAAMISMRQSSICAKLGLSSCQPHPIPITRESMLVYRTKRNFNALFESIEAAKSGVVCLLKNEMTTIELKNSVTE